MFLVDGALTLFSFCGFYAAAAEKVLGSVQELHGKADDVLTAALRVNDVLDMLTLMNKNSATLEGAGLRGTQLLRKPA